MTKAHDIESIQVTDQLQFVFATGQNYATITGIHGEIWLGIVGRDAEGVVAFQGVQERSCYAPSFYHAPLPHVVQLDEKKQKWWAPMVWDNGTKLTVVRVLEKGEAQVFCALGQAASAERRAALAKAIEKNLTPHPVLTLPPFFQNGEVAPSAGP